jgi:CheY-like chemotaxis protein
MVIRTYTQMMQDRLPNLHSLHGNLQEVLKAVDRGASLTTQMLAFSRKQIICPKVLDLNQVIDETAKMLRRVTGENIDFQVTLSDSIWPVEADRDQIIQVLMNLCTNARDAMPKGGTLKIATENVTVRQNDLSVPKYILQGDYVMFSVTDSGTGVSEENQSGVFEPFFTTKDVGDGTGLGLAMVYGIVKQAGGYVWLESELGKGARFIIYMPKVVGVVTSVLPAKAETQRRGTETLLIVEDEGSLRKGFCEFLGSLGYVVLVAGSGEEARLVASGQERLDLLLTDVMLPKMSGSELSQILRRERPNLKVLYMSGYTDDAVLRSGISEQHTAFLQKPFGLRALAGKVRETLELVDPAH